MTAEQLSEGALKVCKREELQQMSRPAVRSLLHLIDKRLQQEGPPRLWTNCWASRNWC